MCYDDWEQIRHVDGNKCRRKWQAFEQKLIYSPGLCKPLNDKHKCRLYRDHVNEGPGLRVIKVEQQAYVRYKTLGQGKIPE